RVLLPERVHLDAARPRLSEPLVSARLAARRGGTSGEWCRAGGGLAGARGGGARRRGSRAGGAGCRARAGSRPAVAVLRAVRGDGVRRGAAVAPPGRAPYGGAAAESDADDALAAAGS